MAKNEFDSDFDFEKEYGFDPNTFLNSEFDEEELDLSEFSEEQLGFDLDEGAEAEEDFSDFDINSLDLGDEELPEVSDLDQEQAEDVDDLDLDLDLDFEEEETDDVDEDLAADMNFTRRVDFFGVPEQAAEPVIDDMGGYEEEPVYEESEYQEETYDDEDDILDDDDDDEDDDEEETESAPKTRRRKPAKERQPIKLTVPPVLIKLWNLYFPPKETWDPQPDPNDSRRRRRKSKNQIFKEFYLPPIIAGVALVLVLSFLIGSLGNAIERKRENDETARRESIAQEQQAEAVQSESERLLEEAAILAAGYDYQAAIDLLNTFSGNEEDYKELGTKKAEYLDAKSKLVEYQDPSTIPNLSFHVLIADPSRAFADTSLGGQYNRNFVTVDEFSKILEQLYSGGYVLVDYDSFITSNTGVDGSESLFSDSIYLPEGKKPVMITETMVNYLSYMIDSNNDGVADAGGDGFANKLVVDGNGDIKAEYVDINNQTHVGDYDLVPILETFIKNHPDFSYRGARATLAVTGSEGIFGYRINSSYVPTMGQSYQDEQKAAAQKVVQALKDKGYTMACFTYDNKNYRDLTALQIQEEMKNWTEQITPVLGEVDIMVFARTSDIDDYSGNKFQVLNNCGFRIFVSNGTSPSTEINTTYVRQSRLMVTGNAMAWYPNQFSGLFDCNLVLDMTSRVSVPN